MPQEMAVCSIILCNYLEATVLAGHLDIEQGHVGEDVEGRGEHLVPARGLRDVLYVVLHRDEGRQGATPHRLVLGPEHPHALPSSRAKRSPLTVSILT
jgi:hypothetical protein